MSQLGLVVHTVVVHGVVAGEEVPGVGGVGAGRAWYGVAPWYGSGCGIGLTVSVLASLCRYWPHCACTGLTVPVLASLHPTVTVLASLHPTVTVLASQ